MPSSWLTQLVRVHPLPSDNAADGTRILIFIVLWREFDKWDSNHAISIPMHPSRTEYQGVASLCSCVLLLNLERLVRVSFPTETLSPADMVCWYSAR